MNGVDDIFNVRGLAGGRFATFEAEETGVGSYGFSLLLLDRAGQKTVLSRGWSEWPDLSWSQATQEVFFAASRDDGFGLRSVSLTGRERLVARLPGDFAQHDVDLGGRLLLEVNSGNDKLIGLRPGETQERELSGMGASQPVDLSADGRQLLLTEYHGPHSNEHDLFLRNTDGSPAVRLGAYYGLALSPDGRWALAFPSGRYSSDHLVLVPTGAGEPRELRHASISRFESAAWFPDGKRIAVLDREGALRRLSVWDVEMSAPPRALLPEGNIDSPVVSPDGRSVVATVANRGLMLYPVDGGPSRPLPGSTAQDQPLRWSADGRWLFVRGTRMPQPDVRPGSIGLISPVGSGSRGRS